jgi:ATP-dependent DNA helicase DinG
LGAVLSAFQQQKTMLLTPAAWEGVSLRRSDGSQLFAELVITRLPFTQTSEEELAALRVSALRRHGGKTAESIAFTRRLNDVKRKLQQGMGRGIRSATDTCRLWIADSRFPLPGAMSTFSGLRSVIPERFWCNYETTEIFSQSGMLERSVHHSVGDDAIEMSYL